jgi:dimethylaniline monooxygenase (N-oxide forming)
VTCLDRSSKYGGLWNYRPDEEDPSGPFEPSVMKTTILNTAKELSAFSDFPPPAWLPNYMRHNHYMDYIDSYVDHFKLKPHLKLEHEIIRCWPEWRAANDEVGRQHIKWLVQVRHRKTTEQLLYQFDRLMVAVGHHNIPFEPAYEGQQRFKGQILHSARLKDILSNKKLADKRVLVIGFGNSACDAANDIAQVASKCYVSCHRGQWFLGRHLEFLNRWQQYAAACLPASWLDKKIVDHLERRVNHRLLGLRPKHQPSEQVPAINDLFPYRIITGAIVLKGPISTFTETGVMFEGEDDECPIDVAVLATGYEARISFLDELQLGIRSLEHNNEYELFLNVFAPKLTLPAHCRPAEQNNNCDSGALQQPATTNTHLDDQQPLKTKETNKAEQQRPQTTPLEAIKSLAFIGLVQPSGSITVVSEMQARYACLIFGGQLELPKMNKMLKHMERMRQMRSKSIRSHSRDQLVGSYLFYMETIAKLAGVMPNLTKLFFKDHQLWRQLMFGPTVPYQYRLSGPGHWPEARQTILTTADRINAGINEGKNHILYKTRRRQLYKDHQDKRARGGGPKTKQRANNSCD